MALERTFSIIKPDAVAKHKIGAILQRFEDAGLQPIAMKKIRLSQAQAEAFYEEHKERGFFGELVSFMISGPVLVQVLEGENAVLKHREVLGATMPDKAEPGTIRYDFARGNEDLSANAAHGSDSLAAAEREIAFFFKPEELVG